MIHGIELLTFNHAGAMTLKDGRSMNYGVIHRDDEKMVYFTGIGLREMWKPNMTNEEKKKAAELYKIYTEPEGKGVEKLMKTGHIAVTFLKDIERIDF